MKEEILKFLGLSKEIKEIAVKKEALQKIASLSAETHPKEFLAYLEGRIIKKSLIIQDIIFQPYLATENSAMPHLTQDVLINNVVGSVHSHPGKSNKPSEADMHFFQKTGIIHAIIRYPYTEEDIQFYDYNSEKIQPKII